MGHRGVSVGIVAAVAITLHLSTVRASAQTPRPLPVAGLGVLPPSSIAGLTDTQPYAPLEFSRAWLGKVEKVRRRREELLAAGRLDGLAPDSAARLGAALSGTLRVLVVPLVYADGRAPFPVKELSDRLFGAPRGDTVTYTSYFDEISDGLLRVTGNVTSWVRLPHTADYYLPRDQYGWAGFGKVAELRQDALTEVIPFLDLGQYDNDGPDGIPDSGDDDGFVDFVVFVYAVPCGAGPQAGAIWPHRGAMEPFSTTSPSKSGGTIRIADYLILPAVDPTTCGPMHVGVLAHETGHMLGLPDLYDYDGSSTGIGAWGLMGTGSHSSRFSPTHMGAWAKEQLGWVTERWLKRDTAGLDIPPVETSHTVYRYDLPGSSGDYVLLENRQRLGSDRYLPGEGLLTWHIDPERGELGAWNSDERSPAVSVVPAAGASNAAEDAEPVPAGGTPHRFEMAGPGAFRLNGVQESDGVVSASVAMAAAPTNPPTPVVRLSAVEGAPPVKQVLRLDSVTRNTRLSVMGGASWLKASRAGKALVVTADPASLPPGAYADTVRLAAPSDTAGASQRRVIVSLEVSPDGGAEVVATQLPWSWGLAVQGDRMLQAGFGWDPLGLRPRPRLLEMRREDPLPRTLARIPSDALYAPVFSPSGDAFVVARAEGDDYVYRVESDGSAAVVARLNSRSPAYGATALPDGSLLVADWSGAIRRVAPDGTVRAWRTVDEHVYQISASAAGDVYVASYEGDVLRLGADGSATRILTGFGRGRLVAVAATPEGDVFAAERGGQGRIIRFAPDGSKEWEVAIPGAQFYGATVNGNFVYLLDLAHRQLLRIPLSGPTKAVARR